MSEETPLENGSLPTPSSRNLSVGLTVLFLTFSKCVLKKFSSALSVCDKYSFQSDPRFAWVDEMENDELYRKIISLPERDIDLLTLIAFEGYSQREVAEIRGIAPAAICKKIAKLKKLLYGG